MVQLGGTIRTIDPQTRKAVEARFRDIVSSSAKLFELEAEIDWRPGYPVTFNDQALTKEAIAAATGVAGADKVDGDYPCVMGSEDFSYMLEKRPGAFVWLGNGDSAGLHQPAYDFNDDAIIFGARYWQEIVGRRLTPAS